jgi:hypothetical protein
LSFLFHPSRWKPIGSGIDITQTLSISERVVGNAVIAMAVREAIERVISTFIPLYSVMGKVGGR